VLADEVQHLGLTPGHPGVVHHSISHHGTELDPWALRGGSVTGTDPPKALEEDSRPMHPSLTSPIVQQRQTDRLGSAARHRLLAEATVQRTRSTEPATVTTRRRWILRQLRSTVSPAS
jgi:hypothetical protein